MIELMITGLFSITACVVALALIDGGLSRRIHLCAASKRTCDGETRFFAHG